MTSSNKYEIIPVLEQSNETNLTNSEITVYLNKERIDCLITAFCKPHCYTNTTNNVYTMYQYDLIKQYYHVPNQVTPSTFLSYDQYKTNSIEIDADLRKCSVDKWPFEFVKQAISMHHASWISVLWAIALELICIMLLVMGGLNIDEKGHLMIGAVMLQTGAFCYIVIILKEYLPKLKRKYYVINFNVFDKQVQKWEIKPRKFSTKYGSLRFDQELYVCQVIKMEPICSFKRFLNLKFQQERIGERLLVRGKISICYSPYYNVEFKLEDSVQNYNDIITAIEQIQAATKNEILYLRSRPFTIIPREGL